MTLQQAMAFAKEEFISSLQYMDLHQLGEITAFGITILGQVTSDILTCNHITEAQIRDIGEGIAGNRQHDDLRYCHARAN